MSALRKICDVMWRYRGRNLDMLKELKIEKDTQIDTFR